jgi:small subunit ribosomal protein S20
MANTSSAKASILKNERNRIRNKARTSRIKTFIDKFKTAMEAKDKELALTAFRKAQSEIMKGKTKGVIKFSTASRLVSRLNEKVKTLTLAGK